MTNSVASGGAMKATVNKAIVHSGVRPPAMELSRHLVSRL